MKDYKRVGHRVWDCKYYVVWTTKYRYPVLGGDVGLRAVRYLKGKSSHKLLSEYESLRKRYWGQHLWGRGYWVTPSGNVTDEIWKQYIEDQKPPEPEATGFSRWGVYMKYLAKLALQRESRVAGASDSGSCSHDIVDPTEICG